MFFVWNLRSSLPFMSSRTYNDSPSFSITRAFVPTRTIGALYVGYMYADLSHRLCLDVYGCLHEFSDCRQSLKG